MDPSTATDNPALTIGKLALPSPFLLAPMAGITGPAMRRLAREFGAAMCYTEMLLAGFVNLGQRDDDRYPQRTADDQPLGIQLCGNDPAQLAEAARRVEGEGFALVDVNLACPVRKVRKKGYGGYLLRDPELVLRIIDALRPAVRVPLTIKIRAGMTGDDRSYIDLCRRAEAAGVDAIAIHGRTVQQQYRGKSDLGRIRALTDAVGIPVLGSGDVFSGADAVAMLRDAGCDGVMLARGAMGSPWIFADALSQWRTGRPADPPTRAEALDVMRRHVSYLLECVEADRAVRLFRRVGVFYSRKLGLGPQFRGRLCTARTPKAVFDLLDETIGRTGQT